MRIREKLIDIASSDAPVVTSGGSTARRWLRAAAAIALFTAGTHVAASVPSRAPQTVARVGTRHASRALGTAPTYGSVASSSNGGAVYNLRVVSDASPDLTDLGSLVSSITSGWPTDREKVWALYYWSHILKRQTPPMLVHGFELADPVRNFADYGFTDCSTISGINQALYEVIGLRHQFWDICNHTVSQVEYDGSFHMIDSSLSNLVTSDDGSRLASVEEAAADEARLVKLRSLYASSPGGFLTGADGLRNLVATMFTDGSTLTGLENAFCATGLKLRDYFYNWDAGHRYVLNLKDGESYTRYYRKLGDTPGYFVGTEPADAPNPAQQFDPEAVSNMGVRANGRWSFTPDLTAAGFARALYSSSNIGAADTVGITLVASGQPGVAIYKVQSANVVTSQSIRMTFAKSDPQADAEIAVSRNHGRRWQLIGRLGAVTGGAIALDIPLRDEVNGAYEVLIRIQMTSPVVSPAAVVLRALTVETITQVNANALPTLHLGRNQISIGEGDQTDTMVLWPELRGDRWRDDAYDFQNIASQPVTLPQIWTAVVYPAQVAQDAYLTYRMDAPNDITRLVYGGRLHNYFAGSYIDYLHSFDGGATWIRSYRFDSVAAPWDVIHYETVTDVPPGTRTVLFRFLLHSTGDEGGRASGLYSARMEATYLPVNGGNAPLDVTWQWAEVQTDRTLVERSHKQRITSFPVTYDINVGGADHPVMRSMRVNLEGSGDGTPVGYVDGNDVGGAKYVHRWRTDGTNLAQGRPYSVSRPPSEYQGSAGASNTTILTDGVVGAPTSGGLTYRWGACWDAGADLDITIDLGGALTAGAFRGHIFGWPDWDALKGEVQERVEVFTSVDGVSFQSRGLLQTSLWKKDVPINYMLRDDGTATAWNFELQPGSPVQARYVTYHITPARVVCVSELQVLDRVTYAPFDIRLSPPGSGGSSAMWPFTVAPVTPQPPAAPSSPVPVDGLVGVGTSPTLTWDAPAATAYDVSFGRTNPPPPVTIGQTVAAYPTPALEAGTTYYWQVVARNANGSSSGPVWSFATASAPPADNPPPPTGNPPPAGSPPADVVVYAADVPASAVHGGWNFATDATSPNGIKLTTEATGQSHTGAPLASPADYVDVAFTAAGGVPYTLWLRLAAFNNAKASDSVWVQFFDASVNGSPVYAADSASALLVNLASDASGASNDRWGWANSAYWLTQPVTVTFAAGGSHTLRIQVRETGVAFDQVVLSPAAYLTAAPGLRTNDTTIVAKPSTAPPPAAPSAPATPFPSDAAVGVSATPTLTWGAAGATTYDVRLGTVNPPPQAAASVTGASYGVAGLISGTRYFWQIVAHNVSGASTGPVWSFTTAPAAPSPPATGGVPAPWTMQDVGAVGLAGSATYAAPAFTVNGAGADIWGSADAFRYVYQTLSGDGHIIARVVSMQNTNSFAKAGVMLRESVAAGAAHVVLDVRPDGSVEFMTRPSAGGATTYLAGALQTAPTWLKLARSGVTVTAYVSSNGSTWTTLGSTPLSIATTATLGLIVSSHDPSTSNTSTFDNVAVASTTATTPTPPPASPLPGPWTNKDVGSTGLAGSASVSNGTFTVKGAGADIWGTADAFQYVYQPLSGDGQIVSRVTAVQNTNTFAKAGVMLRDTTAAGSPHVLLDVRPDGSIEFMARSSSGGATTFIASGLQAPPLWLKLARTGNTATGWVSANGSDWIVIGSTTVAMTSASVGLIVGSHDTSVLNTSAFDNVVVTGSTTTPPTPASPAPAPPDAPGPPDRMTGFSTTPTLSWTATNATSYDVLLGTTNPPPLASQGISTPSYAPARLASATTYFWQVIARNDTAATSGPVWTFSTAAPPPVPPADPPPVAPSSPSPSNGAAGVTVTATLAWTSSGATAYDIAVGTVNPPAVIATGQTAASYSLTAAAATTYFWQITARNASSRSIGPVWSFTTSGPPPVATDVVLYASDIPASSLHGTWRAVQDSASPNGVYFATPDNGTPSSAAAAAPIDYVDVNFDAVAGTPYTVWMRIRALGNSKYNDSLWVQFSGALVDGSPAYSMNTASALLLNLADDASGGSIAGWGWVNGAYWLAQRATVTFANSGRQTLRVQVREDGVAFDQIVLSPTTYAGPTASCPTSCAGAPGPVTNDQTIVPKK